MISMSVLLVPQYLPFHSPGWYCPVYFISRLLFFLVIHVRRSCSIHHRVA